MLVKKGLTFDARGNLPRPTPARPPTVWIGGAVNRTLERVIRWGTGWAPFFAPREGEHRAAQRPLTSYGDLKERIGHLHMLLDRAGRTDPIDICVNLPSPPRGRSGAEAQRCPEELTRLADTGATWIFWVPGHRSLDEAGEHVRWFGSEVIARS